MPKLTGPYLIIKRKDTRKFQLTLYPASGLPPEVCQKWVRKSFQRLPVALSAYREPKSHGAAERGAAALVEHLKAQYVIADKQENPIIFIGNIAKDMYIPDSAHVDRRRQLGKSIDPDTLKEARGYIDKIIEVWGDKDLNTLDPTDVTVRLFAVQRSGSWKNRYLTVLGEIYEEAAWYGLKIQKPAFSTFARNSRKADIFTTDDLKALFRPENFPDDQFFLFFLCCLSGGLRIGEARGIRLKQLLIERKLLIVDGFCKKDGSRMPYNKKGTPEEPKLRAVFLNAFALLKLNEHIQKESFGPDDFIFTVKGKPIRQEWAETVFYEALQKSKLIPLPEPKKRATRGEGRRKQSKAKLKPLDGRKLVPHSLRYTYVTRMRRELPAEMVMKMVGHTSVEMTDYYTRSNIEEIIKSIEGAEYAADTHFEGIFADG
jgi:integrase